MAKPKQPKITPEELISANNRKIIDQIKLFIKQNEERLEGARMALIRLKPGTFTITIHDEHGTRTEIVNKEEYIKEEIKNIEELLNAHKEALRMAQDEEDIMDFIKADPDGNRTAAFWDSPPVDRMTILRVIARSNIDIISNARSIVNSQTGKRPRPGAQLTGERAIVQRYWDKWKANKSLYGGVTEFDKDMAEKTADGEGKEITQKTLREWRQTLEKGGRLLNE